jgi:hypothetical protein
MSDTLLRSAVAAPAPKPTGLVWIASYPKSGNTWTRSFLHNLLKIVRGEGEDAQDINRMNEFTTWDVTAKAYEKYLRRPPKEVDRTAIAAIRPKVQADIADRTDGLAFVKTHHALVADRGVPTINFEVTSGAIYIVRNPLDVAISFAHHMSTTVDNAIEQMAVTGLETAVTEKSVYEVYGSWTEHVRSWTRKPHRAIYVMRYEDMLERPVETFGALAHHLLIAPGDAELAAAIDLSSFDRLRQQEEEAGFREKPKEADRFFRQGRAGAWREKLTRRQVRRIVAAHGEEMLRFGYVTDDLKSLYAATRRPGASD